MKSNYAVKKVYFDSLKNMKGFRKLFRFSLQEYFDSPQKESTFSCILFGVAKATNKGFCAANVEQ